MNNFEDLILHRHGDGFEPMRERRDLDAADLDPERKWVKGARAYQCACGDVFVVGPSHDPDTELGQPLIEPE